MAETSVKIAARTLGAAIRSPVDRACHSHRICERSVGDVSDQLAMPGQQRLWGDDRGELRQQLPSQTFGLGRQAPALTVGEPQSSSTELLSQNAILLTKVVNG